MRSTIASPINSRRVSRPVAWASLSAVAPPFRLFDRIRRCRPMHGLVPVNSTNFPTMSFAVGADAYDRFMGRYSAPLAPVFADFAALAGAVRVLDVGCGPGSLPAELVSRVGPEAVAAVDPSDTFVAAAHARYPAVDVRKASAEHLPFEDQAFDAALAQLVVHFMREPVVGLREMA